MDAARLRRSADIAAVRREGKRLQHALFSLTARDNGAGVMRIAVSAPRAIGSAVTRNRTRRRVREAFRLAIADLDARPGHDVLVVARPAAGAAAFVSLREASRAALESIAPAGTP